MAVVLAASGSHAIALPDPAPVEEYPLHEDGGIVYDPQRREAARTGQLARYANVAAASPELRLGAWHLRVAVPARATAYDVVPVAYELSWAAAKAKPTIPVAVEATAFEDETRRQGRNLFDLALPGTIDLNVEYLGSVTAHLKPGARHNLRPDGSDTPGPYPPFERRPLVCSGVVEAGDLVWFRFRYTNTGNTILDPEGLGGCLFFPQLLRKDAGGQYRLIGEPYNLYIRDLEYLYPGESHETWVHFATKVPGETPQNFGLVPGDYLLRLRLVYRCYRTPDVFLNIWDGPDAVVWEMPFVVESEPREAPVSDGRKVLADAGDPDKITRFLHTFEEFMTAFDCYLAAPADGRMSIRGTLHLQVAPWTRHVVVKLVGTGPVALASAAVPIEVDSDSLRIAVNPRAPALQDRDGRRVPVIASQTMADMRTNVQIGPFVETHIRDRLREMMDCGVNVVSTTSMPWLYDDMREPRSNYQGDAWKYFLELARREGIRIEGWGTYPFDRATIQDIASWLSGRPFKMNQHDTNGYRAVSHADPLLPEANAVAWLYQFRRWGDQYYRTETGQVPISVEDTRGWLRQDVQVRFPMGRRAVQVFREWLRRKYGTIQAVNAAWNTAFPSFKEIDPEKDQAVNEFGHRWEYRRRDHPFHDWSPAVADLDEFRTELRVRNYRDTLEIVRKTIPDATICLRTEGANVLVAGIDPRDPNPHLRHIYYSQRRCGAIAEILQKSGLVRFHSDYTTIPYTPSELRRLIRAGVQQGIVPTYLPQFDNMRDIAINDRYGNDYQTAYNLPTPKKGYMMHCLTALFPWFAVTHEEGGVPGILWEDYQCDGFATETQKREMRLFRQKLLHSRPVPATIPASQAQTRTED